MGASELNKGEPVLALLAPTCADAAPFGKPAESPFYYPASCWIAGFARYETLFGWRLSTPSTMLDVRNVAFRVDGLMDIRVIISPVCTEVLLEAWSRDYDRDDQIVSRPLVMLVGSCDLHSQWSTLLIDKNMDLAASFAPIRRIRSCGSTAKRRRDGLAVYGLPCPSDATLLGIEAHHGAQYPVE